MRAESHRDVTGARPVPRHRVRLALLALGTAGGLVTLFQYDGRVGIDTAPVSAAAVGGPGAPSPAGTAARAPRAAGQGTATVTSVLGDPADTRWGVVQVRLGVRGGKIVSAQAVQSPRSNANSLRINARALPVLAREVLRAQGADVDAVSGATVTSGGYRTSLQSAVDRAHLG